MEYFCHSWAGAPNCYLDMLEKLQKQVHRTVGLFLATTLEPLAYCWDIASWSIFFTISIIDRCLSKLAKLVPLLHFHGRCTYYSNRLHEICVTIPLCYKDWKKMASLKIVLFCFQKWKSSNSPKNWKKKQKTTTTTTKKTELLNFP